MPVFIDQTWDPRMVNKHIILFSPGPLPSYINKKSYTLLPMRVLKQCLEHINYKSLNYYKSEKLENVSLTA